MAFPLDLILLSRHEFLIMVSGMVWISSYGVGLKFNHNVQDKSCDISDIFIQIGMACHTDHHCSIQSSHLGRNDD